MPTIAGRQRPIEKFAEAAAKCSVEASAYGKCILKDYQSVHQDMCAREFMRLKDCYLVSKSSFVLRWDSESCCGVEAQAWFRDVFCALCAGRWRVEWKGRAAEGEEEECQTMALERASVALELQLGARAGCRDWETKEGIDLRFLFDFRVYRYYHLLFWSYS